MTRTCPAVAGWMSMIAIEVVFVDPLGRSRPFHDRAEDATSRHGSKGTAEAERQEPGRQRGVSAHCEPWGKVPQQAREHDGLRDDGNRQHSGPAAPALSGP